MTPVETASSQSTATRSGFLGWTRTGTVRPSTTLPRRRPRGSVMAGWPRKGFVAAVTVSLLIVGASSAGAGRATSVAAKADPKGVLKYARDIPNTFGDNFDPGAETNDCSYAVTS